jgi:hypothetical protein
MKTYSGIAPFSPKLCSTWGEWLAAPGKGAAGTHCLGGSMGPTAGLDVATKRKGIAPDGTRAPTDQPSAGTQLLM